MSRSCRLNIVWLEDSMVVQWVVSSCAFHRWFCLHGNSMSRRSYLHDRSACWRWTHAWSGEYLAGMYRYMEINVRIACTTFACMQTFTCHSVSNVPTLEYNFSRWSMHRSQSPRHMGLVAKLSLSKSYWAPVSCYGMSRFPGGYTTRLHTYVIDHHIRNMVEHRFSDLRTSCRIFVVVAAYRSAGER